MHVYLYNSFFKIVFTFENAALGMHALIYKHTRYLGMRSTMLLT